MSNLYKKKVEILKNIAAHKDNGRMPIIDQAQTWAIAYGGGTLEECVDDVNREIDVYSKHIRDMYFDGISIFGLNRPIAVYKGLGYEPYFASPDKITLQCDANAIVVYDDEVERFTKDPAKFFKEVAIARRYPTLMKDYPEDIEALKRSLKNLMKHKMNGAKKQKALKALQTPQCMDTDNIVSTPLDQYLCYRGFMHGLTDMRRKPQQVKDACEALIPLCAPISDKLSHFPWALNPIVSANYLNPKQFDEFMWPSYKKIADMHINRGAAIGVAFEGVWGKNYEHMTEFPKGSIIGFVEGDDFYKERQKIGGKVALGYPFPINLLKNGTTEAVKDEAKRVIDKVGGCGTFFTTEKCLISPNDINAENYAALGEVSLNYTTK